jgi:hypothetical protein
VALSGSTRGRVQPHLAAQTAELGGLAVDAQQFLDIEVNLGGWEDEGVGHPQCLGLSAQIRGAVGYLDVEGNDAGDDLGKEAACLALFMMAKPRAGDEFGAGDDRDEVGCLTAILRIAVSPASCSASGAALRKAETGIGA